MSVERKLIVSKRFNKGQKKKSLVILNLTIRWFKCYPCKISSFLSYKCEKNIIRKDHIISSVDKI